MDRNFVPKVLVSHPGRQHSHELALALMLDGMLAKYVTGVPARRDSFSTLSQRFLGRYVGDYEIPIERKYLNHILIAPMVRRLSQRMCKSSSAVYWSHKGENWFDLLVSKLYLNTKVDMVVCYENAALQTFREAKSMGMMTILDAASVHHATQDRYFKPQESELAHARIIARKEKEIQLADHILCVSNFAKQSYIDGGVNGKKISVCSMGVDPGQFRSREGGHSHREKRRFLYVGNASPLKGLRLLASAVKELEKLGCNFDVTIIGCNPGIEGIQSLGRLSQEDLSEAFNDYDVLVMPSLFESFGRVALEAMACGLPVIVSDNAGVSELVVEKINGLVFATGSVDALVDKMKWFCDNLANYESMSQSARCTALKNSWDLYRRNASQVIRSIWMERSKDTPVA